MEAVSRQVVIVLGIGHRALERLSDQKSRFLGSEIEGIDGVGYRETLDLTGHIPRLLGRDACILVNGTNFHDRRGRAYFFLREAVSLNRTGLLSFSSR